MSSVFAAPSASRPSDEHENGEWLIEVPKTRAQERMETSLRERGLSVGGGDAAIDGYICTGHETRIVAGEKRYDGSDFVRLANPSKWNSLPELRQHFLILHQLPLTGCADRRSRGAMKY